MEQIQINKMNAQDAVRNVKMEKDSDIKNLVKHTQVLIHEKNQYLDHLPLEQKTFKS